jgi:hypothetical protein
VTTRLPRVATEEVLRYKNWDIPFGVGLQINSFSQSLIASQVPVSSTAYFILMNPTIFPNPREFRPERWIDGAGNFDHTLEKRYLVNFGRGSRQYLGMK